MSTPPKRIKLGGSPPPRPKSRGGSSSEVSENKSQTPSRNLPGHVSNTPAQNSTSTAPSAIKEMQQAILDFANTVSSVNLASIKKQPSQEDSFTNYFSSQYMTANLDDLAKQMKMIGAPGSMDKVDGIWGRNTHQALKNISSIANSLVNINNDMSLGLDQNSIANIENFEKLIPDTYTSIKSEEKSKLAENITNYINAIKKIFAGIKTLVMKDPKLKAVVENKKSLVNVKIPGAQRAETLLNEEEMKIFEQYRDMTLPQSNIKLRDLANPESFKDYMALNKMEVDKPEEMARVLNQLDSAIG